MFPLHITLNDVNGCNKQERDNTFNLLINEILTQITIIEEEIGIFNKRYLKTKDEAN